MTRYLPKTMGALALVVVIAALAMIMGRDASGQGTYFAPCGKVTIVNPAAGAASDIQTQFGVGIGSDCVVQPGVDDYDQYNFGGIVAFTPPDWGVPADDAITNGTAIGGLQALSTLGLLNNPCTTNLNVNFSFYEGSADPNGAQISPLPAGTADRMKPLREDANGDSIPDGATAWPSYLTELFDEADLTKVHARYLGVATIVQASNLTVILNFIVFEPGAKISNDPLLTLDPRLGYPSVTVLQDPTAAASSKDFINDFCSPLLTNTTLLSNVRTNPAASGTYNFVTAVRSQRDADGDGFENGLDTCPYLQNVGNPRLNPDIGDNDHDGIDAACDPDLTQGRGQSGAGLANTDEDGDLWMNRNDNCPLLANDDQKDEDSDGVGDVCDQHVGDADAEGKPERLCFVAPVTIGSGGASAIDPLTLLPCNPNGTLPQSETPTPVGQTPTPVGQTPKPTTASQGGGGVPGSANSAGIGSLSPVGTDAPLWAVMLTALGVIGIITGTSLVAARARKQR